MERVNYLKLDIDNAMGEFVPGEKFLREDGIARIDILSDWIAAMEYQRDMAMLDAFDELTHGKESGIPLEQRIRAFRFAMEKLDIDDVIPENFDEMVANREREA